MTTDPKFPNVEVQLIGTDGNAFGIVGRVVKALRQAGERQGAADFEHEAMSCESYDELLRLTMQTVEVS